MTRVPRTFHVGVRSNRLDYTNGTASVSNFVSQLQTYLMFRNVVIVRLKRQGDIIGVMIA